MSTSVFKNLIFFRNFRAFLRYVVTPECVCFNIDLIVCYVCKICVFACAFFFPLLFFLGGGLKVS